MTLLTTLGNQTTSDEQAYSVYVAAIIKNSEAAEQFPKLEGATHQSLLADVYSEVAGLTKFVKQATSKGSNHYSTHRIKVKGEINGPATSLKFIFSGQRNFTMADATALHTHLKTVFPNIKLNVVADGKRPLCLVHIAL